MRKYQESMRLAETYVFLFYDCNGDSYLLDHKDGQSAWDCAKEICGEDWESEKHFWSEYSPELCHMDDGAGGTCTVRCTTLAKLAEDNAYINDFCDSTDWSESVWKLLQSQREDY